MAKYTFEEYLSFVEGELGIQLLSWQKLVLQKIYNGEYGYYMPGRTTGRVITYEASKRLKELMKEED